MSEKVVADSPLCRLERSIQRLERMVADSERRRADQYRLVLIEAAHVLRQTKSAFRSRQIKELRERIEAALSR